MVTLYRLV